MFYYYYSFVDVFYPVIFKKGFYCYKSKDKGEKTHYKDSEISSLSIGDVL